MLHREDRGEILAKFAEALLALPESGMHPKVLYARGSDGLTVAFDPALTNEDQVVEAVRRAWLDPSRWVLTGREGAHRGGL